MCKTSGETYKNKAAYSATDTQQIMMIEKNETWNRT